jgi:hypothetical protein
MNRQMTLHKFELPTQISLKGRHKNNTRDDLKTRSTF